MLCRLHELIDRLRGSLLDRELARSRRLLARVNAMESDVLETDELRLRDLAADARGRIARAPHDEEPLALALAVAREAGRRTLGLRLHDVQVLAALELHAGRVVEMATGEGKTLAAVAPAWLAAARHGSVHVLTFNDYLARRDADWMRPVHELLGVTVGCVQDGMSSAERREAYACDVTYATAKQAGFDYLRDQLVRDESERVHSDLRAVIIDEADSILIDEARVPLVIAGGRVEHPVDPRTLTDAVRRLEPGRDHEVDEHGRNVELTEAGLLRAEELLGLASLHDDENRDVLTALNLALHAETLLRRDVDYIVRDGGIEVVDEFTGRVVADRRWPDGLHPALEAKEGLAVRAEGRVLGSLPLQHFICLYDHVAGMTATAATAQEELEEFYGLGVSVVPPHQPCVRIEEPDLVFRDRASKERAVVDEIRRVHDTGRPVLVGTASVRESETLARALASDGLSCTVLNAKNDAEEASSIAEAGRLGAITISTNMAGRGTDIRLGGADDSEQERVVQLGGLHVVGTNRHESRRIDDQLRGRAGRQGDPGSSRFLVSLEDDLVERYGDAEELGSLRARAGTGGEHAALADAITDAQRRVEWQNFDIRRTLWRYASIVEVQRRVVTDLRGRVLAGDDVLARDDPPDVLQHVTLVELDRCWADHLAAVADVREGIHLASLTGQDAFGGLFAMRKTPLGEYEERMVAAFGNFQERLEERVALALEALEEPAGEDDLPKGPESTWTYLVHDTPFETTLIRMARTHARLRRGG